MKRWSLGVSVLALLVAIAASALTTGVLYMDRAPAASATPSVVPLANASQICLAYRTQVLYMHIHGVYAKQMIDIFNLELVSMNSKGERLLNRSPAYDYFYKGACGPLSDIIPRLSRVSRRQ